MTENDKTYLLRMNGKLKKQLERYAKSNDLTLAQTARKALRQFIDEEKNNN